MLSFSSIRVYYLIFYPYLAKAVVEHCFPPFFRRQIVISHGQAAMVLRTQSVTISEGPRKHRIS